MAYRAWTDADLRKAQSEVNAMYLKYYGRPMTMDDWNANFNADFRNEGILKRYTEDNIKNSSEAKKYSEKLSSQLKDQNNQGQYAHNDKYEFINSLYKDKLGRPISEDEWKNHYALKQGEWQSWTDLVSNSAEARTFASKLASGDAVRWEDNKDNPKNQNTTPGAGDVASGSFMTPEMQSMLDTINSRLAKEPKLDPVAIRDQWMPFLNEAFAPAEAEAKKSLNESYNFASPYSYGSGGQLKATSDMIAKQTSSKMAEAIALGKLDYGYQQTQRASDQARQAAILGIQNQNAWDTKKREWAEEDYNRSSQLAKELADMGQTREPQWWEYIAQPLLTGIGTGIGGPVGGAIGGGIANWMTSNKQKDTASTGSLGSATSGTDEYWRKNG